MVNPGKVEPAEAEDTQLSKPSTFCTVIVFITLFMRHRKLKDQFKETLLIHLQIN